MDDDRERILAGHFLVTAKGNVYLLSSIGSPCDFESVSEDGSGYLDSLDCRRVDDPVLVELAKKQVHLRVTTMAPHNQSERRLRERHEAADRQEWAAERDAGRWAPPDDVIERLQRFCRQTDSDIPLFLRPDEPWPSGATPSRRDPATVRVFMRTNIYKVHPNDLSRLIQAAVEPVADLVRASILGTRASTTRTQLTLRIRLPPHP